MPEFLHLPPVAAAVATITGIVLAVLRLLTASKGFWWRAPEWLQKGLPMLLVGLGQLPEALAKVESWRDLITVAVAFAISVGAWFTASRGDKRPVEKPPSSGAGKEEPVHVLFQNPRDPEPPNVAMTSLQRRRRQSRLVLAFTLLLSFTIGSAVSLLGCSPSALQAQRDASNVVARVANDTVEPALLAAYKATGLVLIENEPTRELAQAKLQLHQERWKPIWAAWEAFKLAHTAWQNQIEEGGDVLTTAAEARKSFCELRKLAAPWRVELPDFPGPLGCGS